MACAVQVLSCTADAWIVDPAVAAPSWRETCARMRATSNRHVYFRTVFDAAAPVKAVLRFAADDMAAVTLDGALVAEGPELGYPQAQPIAQVDVTEHLKGPAREHVLAADVYYLGCTARSTSSGDGRFGLRARLEMTFADGSVRTVETGPAWRTFVATTRTSARKPMGYGTQFNEDTDLRREPHGWRLPGFDDCAWEPAVTVTDADYAFIPAQGRPLQYVRRTPVKAEKRPDGSWFWDMGEEMCGTPVVTLTGGAPGQRVILKEGEECTPEGAVRHRLRCNCDYSDAFVLRGGRDTLDYYDYRAFRYVALEGWTGAPPELTVRERHYPFDAARTSFTCADARFERIWKMCVNGVRVGTQDRFMDCPSREKGQYTGDAWMTAVPRWWVTADPTIWRKAVLDFARSQSAEDPCLLCVAPGSFKQRLAEWSMLWTALAADYVDASGDVALARTLLRDGTLARFAAGFKSLENADGLYCDPGKKLWILTDWPKEQRCGYDYDATIGGGALNTWANAFYYGMLRNLAKLHRAGGDAAGAAAQEARAEAFKAKFNAAFLDSVTGHYRDGRHADGTPSPKSSHQAGVGALYWGLVPESAKARVVEKIARERIAGSIFSGFYAIAALAENGRADLAWELLAGDDPHSWATMIKEGATTPFEAWSKEDKWNTSLCHPFAAVPIVLFAKHLLGLSWDPVARTIAWRPKSGVNLPAFSFVFPLPDGRTATAARTATGEMKLISH